MIRAAAGPPVHPRDAHGSVLWIVAILMIVVGVVGTVLPALPGVVLVFGGIVLAAWIDDFTRISGWTVGALAVLTLLAFAADYVAAALGAKKAGASKLAIVGAAIGTVAGVFTGFVGLLFMPLARRGARRIHRAARSAPRRQGRHRDLARAADRHRGEGRDRVHDGRRVRRRASRLSAV